MSFATLSNTIEDCSAISALEVTKNPFDSGVDGRLHMPSLSSPSIFLQQNTPGSQKVGTYHPWYYIHLVGHQKTCCVLENFFILCRLLGL